jgi:hypothetical protein
VIFVLDIWRLDRLRPWMAEAELPWTALLRVQPPYIQHKGHGFKKKKPTSKGKQSNR